MKKRVLHYDNADLWDVNICGTRGTRYATGDVKKVTCKGCRRHLTYWVARLWGRRWSRSRGHYGRLPKGMVKG